MLPVIVCVDVEPDRRLPQPEPLPFHGFEAVVSRLPDLRARLGAILGPPPRFTWTLRMDPHIATSYGSSTWVADTYGGHLDALVAQGDALGIHPHMWRLEPTGWWSDNADADWVGRCVATALEAYQQAFDRPCQITRCGDRFLSPAVVAQLEAAGVIVDLTIEPGLEAASGLADDEPTRGTLPDTRTAPSGAYRVAAGDMLRADPGRRDALVELPLTPGVTVSPGAGQWLPTGSYRTLTLWTEPRRFALQLDRRLRSDRLTHLAFAIRSDVALLSSEWAAVDANLEHLAKTLHGTSEWVTALEAVDALEDRLATPPPPSSAPADRSRGWRLGEADPAAHEGLDPARSPSEEPPVIEWLDGSVPMSCPACSAEGPGDRVARTFPAVGVGVEAQRCRSCRSVRLVGPHVGLPDSPAHLTDMGVDAYVEHLGAVEVIASTLAGAGTWPAGTRVVDIGCGYGFGVAMAAGLWAWDGQGVDPGEAAAIGAEQLGHPLHAGDFGPDMDLGGPVDIILASEVIEHVLDPLAMLRAMRGHLTDHGVLVLTTPDGDAVDPARTVGEVLPAMGAGGHVCLLSEGALRSLMAAGGFPAARVERRGATLHAVGAGDEASLRRTQQPAPHDLVDIAAWALRVAGDAPPDSALRVGLAARAARFLMHRGELDQARRARELLRTAILARHEIDLDDPDATRARSAQGRPIPLVVADAHHTSGVLLLHAGDHLRAGRHLLATADAAREISPRTLDPSARWMEANALGQATVALARSDPAEIVDVVRRLVELAPDVAGIVDTDALIARAFTEAVAAGHIAVAQELRTLLPPVTPAALAAGGESRRAALDGLFMGAMLDQHLGGEAEARRGFEQVRDLASDLDDDHARQMVAQADQHARMVGA